MPADAHTRPIIIGSGLAGLWAAWRLALSGRASMVLTKSTLTDSASAWAQGGVAAAVGPGDSPALHAADTLAAADGLADPKAVGVLTTEGPDRIGELLALGATFDRDSDGRFRLGLEGAHSRPRILHAGGDRTGAMIVERVARRVFDHPLIEISQRTEVARLLADGDRIVGVVAIGPDARPFPLFGPAVVLATGGIGQLYAVTTNPPFATADGWALAHGIGLALKDVEFLQFHPTALKAGRSDPAPLISEAVRGAGATLVDGEGRRFLLRFDPRAELAPRDVVAQGVAAADAAGGAWLDARQVVDFVGRFPGIAAMLRCHGLDASRDRIPVAPAMHYAMGGVKTDLDGRTGRRGLWAVGEVACTGVHGANRLGSNSLLEALVFADRVARAIAAEPQGAAGRPRQALGTGSLSPEADAGCEGIRSEMRRVMSAHVGVRRSAISLFEARGALAELAARTPPAAWRTRSQLAVARLITDAALRRRESRGSHLRTDYPRHAVAGR